MQIAVDENEHHAIVRVTGRVVRENQVELRKKLEEAIANGARGIALDFAGVEYLDSAGLGCCASVHKLMQDKGCGSMVMFGPLPNIEKMWKLIRLDLVIPCFRWEAEALAALKKASPTAGG
jgi:anti-sigma B factor antagonist